MCPDCGIRCCFNLVVKDKNVAGAPQTCRISLFPVNKDKKGGRPVFYMEFSGHWSMIIVFQILKGIHEILGKIIEEAVPEGDKKGR